MRIYNSLTKKIEKFIPLDGKRVKMYVCGITPYDTTHLGHAFTYVFYDVLRRYLVYKDYQVIDVQNVTDIDDDILKKAKEVGKGWKELGESWTRRYLKDMKELNVYPPIHFIKATDSIPAMITIIKGLIRKRYAYVRDANVYFDIKKFPEYGKLSCFNRAKMIVLSRKRGADPDDPLKKDPLDFILWQSASRGINKGEPSWPSPWGAGRPGWHIECSAMIREYLGEQIDIHGGGHDLIYPHHESEIAQMEAYAGKKPFVKYWVHTGMVMYQGEKMAKSLGNLVMVADLVKKYSPAAIRWLLLSHHYRKPWEFEERELVEAEKTVKKIKASANTGRNTDQIDSCFINSMDNDLNTPEALRMIKDLTGKKNSGEMMSVLGFI
jgi:L-cysteine:1D-myo-inositol 2-amino-2-deoxy-alpha-D-glucopyranoside ligase